MKTTWSFAASAHEKYDLGFGLLGLYWASSIFYLLKGDCRVWLGLAGRHGEYRVWYIGVLLGLYWDNGKENVNYRVWYIGVILGLYWDNGKENGNYRVWYIGVILG